MKHAAVGPDLERHERVPLYRKSARARRAQREAARQVSVLEQASVGNFHLCGRLCPFAISSLVSNISRQAWVPTGSICLRAQSMKIWPTTFAYCK